MENNMNNLIIAADVSKLPDVIAFVDDLLEKFACPMKAQMQIDIALEELFVNIAHYADLRLTRGGDPREGRS